MAVSPRVRSALGRTVALSALTLGVYVALLFAPGPLFRYAYAGTVVTLHSDRPLPPEASGVTGRVEAKLQRSPLFEPSRMHDVYVCNSEWRWWLLSSGDRRSAAIALLAGHGGSAVITREARLATNRLLQASGLEGLGERTLDYYLAHEITHEMTAEFLGPKVYRALPAWVREGYADYVGRGTSFDYEDARAALTGDAAGRRSPAQTGFYLRDALLVAHLLDREGWSVPDLLRAAPVKAATEDRVRAGLVAPRR